MGFSKRVLSSLLGWMIPSGIFITPVQAEIVMFTLHTDIQTEDTITAKTYITTDRMRVELRKEGRDITSIFHLDEKVFWMIENKDSTYQEITEKDLQEIKEKIEQLEERMNKLPNAVRRIIEGVTGGKVRAAKIPYTYAKKASGVKVKNWKCDHYEGTFEGIKVEEVWSAYWKDLGFTRGDFQVLEDLGEFFNLGAFTEEYDKFYRLEAKEGEYTGIPIRRVHYLNGVIQSITELIEIERKNLPSTLFDIPEGLVKKNR